MKLKRHFCNILTLALFALLASFATTAKAQEQAVVDSAAIEARLDSVDISLITCEQYEVVYALYGHTAIRINDMGHGGQDIIVNYGVFDKTKPNFVPNFILGLTDYTMAYLPTELFMMEYSYFGSQVTEQVLNITNQEKLRIIAALEDNYRPENREYRYNFIFNNCTSKARDIIVDNLNGRVTYTLTEKQVGEQSFRELIHWMNNGYNWAAFGNDMLLGVDADRNTELAERQFLPEILMNDFNHAVITGDDGSKRNLVKTCRIMLPHGVSKAEPMTDFPLTPLYTAFVISILVLLLTLAERFLFKRRFKVFDYIFFSLFGIVGLILTAMLFSEHPTVRCNLQIFLFSPLWFGLVWVIEKKNWAYYTALALIVIFWIGGEFQNYAEGVNLLAWALLARIINMKIWQKTTT